MSTFFSNVIFPLLTAFIVLNAAFVIGKIFLDYLKLSSLGQGIRRSAVGVLIGYGALAGAAVAMALIGPLSKSLISLMLAAIIFVGRRHLWSAYRRVLTDIRQYKNFDNISKILLVGIVFCFVFYFTSALVPPYRTDALAYHLPEAREIASEGLSFPVIAGGKFFGNLPILMENFYALLYKLSGFTAINLSHYFIVLAGLFFIYGFVKHNFSRRAALISVLGLFSLYEFFVGATNAYIDSAMVIYEVSGLLLLISWMQAKESKLLLLSGICYGLAISIKYNGLYGLAIGGTLLITYLLLNKFNHKEILKNLAYFSLAVLAVAGFWYFKNLVLYHNPFYPFIFGHSGFTDKEYWEAHETIKLFIVPRTLINFLRVPFTFFSNIYYPLVIPAFIIWPFTFIWGRKKDSRGLIWRALSVYCLAYLVIWFFTATHQVRFVTAPLMIIIIFLGIQLAGWLEWLEDKNFFNKKIVKLVVALVLILVAAVSFKLVSHKDNYFFKVKKIELGYALGFYDQSNFYHQRGFGSLYDVSQYINTNYRNTNFLNIWKTSNFFLKHNNLFVLADNLYYDTQLSTTTLVDYLKQSSIPYAIVDRFERSQAFNAPIRNNNAAYVQYRTFVVALEDLVKKTGSKVYEDDNMEVYNFIDVR